MSVSEVGLMRPPRGDHSYPCPSFSCSIGLFAALLICNSDLAAKDVRQLLAVRHYPSSEGVRVELAFSELPEFKQYWSDRGTYFIFSQAKLQLNLPAEISIADAALKKVRLGAAKGPRAIVALDIEKRDLVTVNTSRSRHGVNILITPRQPAVSSPVKDSPPTPAAPPAVPEQIPVSNAVPVPERSKSASDSTSISDSTDDKLMPGVRLELLRSEHLRLPLNREVLRIAVGDPEILGAEPIGSREILVLGKRWGNSSLIIWFKDGTVSEHRVWVMRDLQLLSATLRAIDSRIKADAAPDRDAIVLTGTVRDIVASQAATRIAQNYLDASRSGRETAEPLLGSVTEATGPAASGADVKAIRVSGKLAQSSGAVINMLTLENLPQRVEDRIRASLEGFGNREIVVRRIQKGPIPDDEKDVFVLEGTVQNQVQLTRVLLVAAQGISGRSVSQEDLRVLADESGALVSATGNGGLAGSGTSGFNASGASGGVFGNSGGNNRLVNQVGRNLGRAKAIEVAGGRVISFLHVRDLPQVRVNIRLYEVNRNKLRGYSAEVSALGSNRGVGNGLSGLGLDSTNQSGGPGLRNSVEGIISFIAGSLNSSAQFSSSNFAIDAALSLLEKQGIARSLSSPSLTVLSGELAHFQVGGQIPLPQAFIPAQSNAAAGTNGVYSSVVFEEFGVRLAVRPLVDDFDSITLDLMPQIITPNADLTASIRDTTGTNQITSAFSTRSLRTSARLADGQSLLVGGLLSRESSEQTNGFPGAQDLPGIGKMFRNSNKSDNAQELIVVVNPVVLRDSISPAGMWAYPETSTLIPSVQPPPKK